MTAWLGLRRRGGQSKDPSHNRINLLVAVIFCLGLALIGKLAYLQIFKHEQYLAKAAEIHSNNSKLEPERGKIYLVDKEADGGLYPIATNKEYVLIYAVPKDLTDSDRLINKVYDWFKKSAVELEVNQLLVAQDQDRLNKQLAVNPNQSEQVRQEHQQLLADSYYQSLKEQKKQEMIEARRTAIYQDLQKKLSNKEDQYEVLEKKVDLETAKKFQLSLISDLWESSDIKADDLSFKNNQVYWNHDGLTEKFDYPGVYYQSDYYRYYLDNELACHILGYTDLEKSEQNGVLGRRGHYGLEGFFDDELFGQYGSIQSEKGAGGLLIVLDQQQEAKQNGDDIILTLDRSIQFFVNNALKRAVSAYSADHASAIVMNPNTGAIIAMASYPGFDPNNYNQITDPKILNNPNIFDQYEPGSIFKPITMASALDLKSVTANSTYVDNGQRMIKGWPKPISNSDYSTKGAHGLTTMSGILENSLNTGAIFVMESMGSQVFADYVKRFGFGERTGIELEGEAKGDIANINTTRIKEINAATASFGQGITVTPIQMISAFSALANGGKLVKPHLVKEIRYPNGNLMTTPMINPRRIISQEASADVTAMLINVAEKGHSKGAKVPGYYVAGKTGTAQIANRGGYGNLYNHSFVGYAPADKPKFVVMVKVSEPKGFEYAESTAVPVAHDIIEFILNYWQVPKNRN